MELESVEDLRECRRQRLAIDVLDKRKTLRYGHARKLRSEVLLETFQAADVSDVVGNSGHLQVLNQLSV